MFNRQTLSISLGFIMTILLFYYLISLYQANVPGTAKWLIKGKILKSLAAQEALNQAPASA